jgi:hypothetical protein
MGVELGAAGNWSARGLRLAELAILSKDFMLTTSDISRPILHSEIERPSRPNPSQTDAVVLSLSSAPESDVASAEPGGRCCLHPTLHTLYNAHQPGASQVF